MSIVEVIFTGKQNVIFGNINERDDDDNIIKLLTRYRQDVLDNKIKKNKINR